MTILKGHSLKKRQSYSCGILEICDRKVKENFLKRESFLVLFDRDSKGKEIVLCTQGNNDPCSQLNQLCFPFWPA